MANANACQTTTLLQQNLKRQRKLQNIRYGQNISESGIGGTTTNVGGESQQSR
jgi:hypothetical protein